MLVSVIIPNYNHAQFLKQRIESVLNQTFKKIEIIILDDCSTDNSREIIEEYRLNTRITKIIYNSKNRGVFKQWEKGISIATGQYIWIAESDDWASPDFLEKLTAEISNTKNTGICFCGSNWIDDEGNLGKDLSIYQSGFHKSGKEEIKQHLVKYNTIQNASAALLRTDLAKKHIAGAIGYKSCGDWYLYINILSESDLIFVEEKLNNFRWYHANTSNTAFKKGVWVKEGINILANSRASTIRYTLSELKSLFRYWITKPLQTGSLQSGLIRIQTICFFSAFAIKTILRK